jgi:hypothetical protein
LPIRSNILSQVTMLIFYVSKELIPFKRRVPNIHHGNESKRSIKDGDFKEGCRGRLGHPDLPGEPAKTKKGEKQLLLQRARKRSHHYLLQLNKLQLRKDLLLRLILMTHANEDLVGRMYHCNGV